MTIGSIETITIESEGMTLALLIWRRFRRPMPGLVELALAENPGLADLGSFLPVGTTVRLPIPAERQEPEISPVRLWG